METNISSHQSQLQQTATGQEMEPKGIVLNRMYTGSYLSTNLGHEVINMFQADNGKHYLYLNARGNFSKEGKQVNTMLLVRHIGGSTVEAVGMAKNLKPIDSACCTLPRDIGRINQKVRNEQEAFLKSTDHKVEYGEVPIIKIFGDKGQQSVYVSYWVEKNDFFIPAKNINIRIEFPPSDKNKLDDYKKKALKEEITVCSEEKQKITTTIVRMKEHNFSSTSLHQFIFEGEDFKNLSALCNENGISLWEQDNTKVDKLKDNSAVDKREISLFDICQIQKDENRISNALSYFIDKYPKLWHTFFSEQLSPFELGEIESVTREENAKIKENNSTGGRIDLLIRTKNCYIILENKIDSEIIIENNVTQLQRYYNYVSILKTQESDRLDKEKTQLNNDLEKYKKYYEDPNKKHWKNRSKWQQKINELTLKFKNVEQELQDVENRKIEGFVLTPNYNPPKLNLLEVNNDFCFKWLSYKTIYEWLTKNEDAKCLIEKDANFKAFYNVIKRHTYEFESSMLYEEMKNTFFTRIKELNHTSSSTR